MATAKKAAAPAKGKTPGTAVTTRKTTDVAIPDEVASLMMEDAQDNLGFSKDDLAIPFLRVLQKGSPEVNKRDDKYVDGAEPGMFFNTLTRELWEGEKDGVRVIPVHYSQSFIEWWPRDHQGPEKGIYKDHGADGSILDITTRDEKTGRDTTQRGTEVIRSGQYYAMVVDPETGDAQQVVISLSGTQLKKSRKWNSLISSLLVPKPDGSGKFRPAMFYMSYTLTSVYEKNDKGDWFGVQIDIADPVIQLPKGADLYAAAREFRNLINEGRVRVQQVEDVEVEVTDGEQSF